MAGETKAVPTAFAKPKVKLSSAALTGQVFSNLVATTEQIQPKSVLGVRIAGPCGPQAKLQRLGIRPG